MQYSVFISHSYQHSSLYDHLRIRLKKKGNHFSLRNESIPEDSPVLGKSDDELREDIRGRIERSDVVLVFTRPVAARSRWIKEELDIAAKLGKPVIAITPRKQDRKSSLVLERAKRHVQPWRVDSVISAIREEAQLSRRNARRERFSIPAPIEGTSVKEVVGATLLNSAPAAPDVPPPSLPWWRKFWFGARKI